MDLGDAEYLEEGALAARRQALWEVQSAHVAAHSAFYRRLWQGKAPPRRWQDIPALPLSTKPMLRASQAAHPPFGDYLAAPRKAVARLHRTSGTTGQPMNIALSEADARMFARVGGRAARAAGLGPGSMVIHCLNYCLWMGGYTDHATLEASGATVVPFGVGQSALLVQTLRDLPIDAIYCTPSYPAVLERVVAERGLRPADLGLKVGILTGEAGLENPAFRARVEATWGFKARNLYGISDVVTTIAGECAEGHDLHFAGPDALVAELVDPDSGSTLDWREGAEGELVLTHLERECQPLVRFRTGDVMAVTATGRCACGRTSPRLRFVGRTDDMVVVRGVNVFPGDVAAVLNAMPALSGEFRVRLAGPGPYDRLPVEAELAQDSAAGEGLAAAVEARLKDATRASARVALLPFGALPRSEGKTRRIVREDE